jgi:hypothetical protein
MIPINWRKQFFYRGDGMNLEKLYMHRSYSGEFNGKASFTGESGEITLNLNKEQCKQILIVLGDGLIRTARDSAERLTAEVIEGVVSAKKIEAKL